MKGEFAKADLKLTRKLNVKGIYPSQMSLDASLKEEREQTLNGENLIITDCRDEDKEITDQPKRQGVDLSRFYIHSGVRENTFCEKNPKYRMAPLPISEARGRDSLI